MNRELEALVGIVAAWEEVPEGNHSPARLERWIMNTLAPAIRKCREVLPVELHSETTKEAMRRYAASE